MNNFSNKMPKALGEAWFNALESGEYAQAAGTLCAFDDGGNVAGYCCLGVLQMVADGKVERWNSGAGTIRGIPSVDWLSEHNIQFRVSGALQRMPFVPKFERGNTSIGIAYFNDGGVPFKEIAKMLRENIELV